MSLFALTQTFRDMTPVEFQLAMSSLLERTFCSSRWLFDSFDVVKKGSGEVVFRFVPGRYPPGGKDTRMVRCPACRRLTPRDIDATRRCLDCQEVDFLARAEWFQSDPLAAQVKDELWARWWRSRPPSQEAATNPEALLSSRSVFSTASDRTDFASDRLADELAFAGNEPVTSDQRRMGKGCRPRERVLAHLAWLFNPKEGSTRSRGSRVYLLDDRVETLKKEIDYFNRKFEALKGEVAGIDLRLLVAPGATRIDNPFKPDKRLRRRKPRRKSRRKSRFFCRT